MVRFEVKMFEVLVSKFLFAESNIQWEIDFYPRGIRYSRAQLINVFNMPHQGKVEVPETILRTVRVRCTCKGNLYNEQRFKVKSKFKLINLSLKH
jgi:hypothetical protein